MKRRYSFGMVVTMLVLTVFYSCATEPEPVQNEVVREVVRERVVTSPPDTLMPLTVSILQRLGETSAALSQNIGRYQLLLFGRVFLEREYTQSETYVEEGKAKFEDVHIRENVTINDQTEGQAITLGNIGDEIVISVCFEQDEKYRLRFSTYTGDPDAYFYLNYDFLDSLSPFSDEKGVLEYGGEIYKLKYAGDKRPYLLIKLSQSDTDKLNSRIAPGRRVN